MRICERGFAANYVAGVTFGCEPRNTCRCRDLKRFYRLLLNLEDGAVSFTPPHAVERLRLHPCTRNAYCGEERNEADQHPCVPPYPLREVMAEILRHISALRRR